MSRRFPKREPLACVYAPGFAEALREICRLGRQIPKTKYAAGVLQAALAQGVAMQSRPEMCDKFLSLDSREPFVRQGDIAPDEARSAEEEGVNERSE